MKGQVKERVLDVAHPHEVAQLQEPCNVVVRGQGVPKELHDGGRVETCPSVVARRPPVGQRLTRLQRLGYASFD